MRGPAAWAHLLIRLNLFETVPGLMVKALLGQQAWLKPSVAVIM